MATLRGQIEDALETVRARRVEIEAELEQLNRQEAAYVAVLETTAADIELRKPERELSVKSERKQLVREYMSRHKTAVQSDIVKALGENSGTVSIAIRMLEEEGVVKRGAVKNRSREWHWIGKDREEVRSHAGHGSI